MVKLLYKNTAGYSHWGKIRYTYSLNIYLKCMYISC